MEESFLFCYNVKMTKKFFKKIQKRVIDLLKSKNKKPLYVLAKDNCSEMSRLVAFWMLKEHPKLKISVLKGKDVFGIKKRCHDILMVEDDNMFYLIDPTVWQFLKYKRNIVMTEKKSEKDILTFTEEVYKGKWKISKIIGEITKKEAEENEKIIKLNLAEIE